MYLNLVFPYLILFIFLLSLHWNHKSITQDSLLRLQLCEVHACIMQRRPLTFLEAGVDHCHSRRGARACLQTNLCTRKEKYMWDWQPAGTSRLRHPVSGCFGRFFYRATTDASQRQRVNDKGPSSFCQCKPVMRGPTCNMRGGRSQVKTFSLLW